jgi:lipopolysaccharide/colanic/teichoic acid biosynthesis glycosyltransferase
VGLLSDIAAIESVSKEAKTVSRYLLVRQRYDWMLALFLALLMSPILIGIGLLTYINVGRPVIFWQTRIGRFRHLVTIHKFRTLPHRGEVAVGVERQPSFIGQFLQVTRLDELPQIFDVIERQLAFIGPRPLLPQHLPSQTGLREQVLPGITGWAQIHGGKTVSAEEKVALDHWYLRNATPKLDLYILFKTCLVALRGYEKRDDVIIADAMREFYDQTSDGALKKISVMPHSSSELHAEREHSERNQDPTEQIHAA